MRSHTTVPRVEPSELWPSRPCARLLCHVMGKQAARTSGPSGLAAVLFMHGLRWAWGSFMLQISIGTTDISETNRCPSSHVAFQARAVAYTLLIYHA